MKSRLLRSTSWALPLVLLLILLAFLRFQSAPDSQSETTAAAPPHPWSATPRHVDTAPIHAFSTWLADEKNADSHTHGVSLARERRAALKELIQVDPEAALAHAVPYAARRELPRELQALLETPISTTADLNVAIACGIPGIGSHRQQWITLGDQTLQVFTYGQRAEVMTKEKLSIHGIAIDDVMAMLDDPLREWSPEEVADHGHTGRIAQLGNRLLEIESDDALAAARQRLRETEEAIGPVALTAYRELALGEMDGLYPIVMQDGKGGPEDDEEDLPPIAFSSHTLGAKTMLYIRARFADEAPDYEPVTLASAQANQGNAEAFWEDNSYGKSTLTTTYTDVITLPKNGGQYVNNFETLLQDARQAAVAANPAWNHTNFNFYTIITNNATNNQGQSFLYSGIAQLGGPGSHLLRNFISVRTASHEYGHNLGLNHSEYWLTDSTSPIGRDSIPGGYVGDNPNDERIEYGHRFAVMAGQFSNAFENGRAHYTASDKNRINWLDEADGEIITTTTSGTYRLYRHDVPSSEFTNMTPNVARGIKIDLPATTPPGINPPYKYWLNYRWLQHDGIATTWLRNGIQVDWRQDGHGFRSVMLDMTPYSRDSGPYGANPGPFADNDDKDDGMLLIGRTFSDTGADIHFTPIARNATEPNQWLDIVINIGTQTNNAAPVISNFTVSNPTPNVGQNVNFAVTATDPDGDTLAYHWDMGDNSIQPAFLNQPTRSKSWPNAGYYVVRVEVSDMKGGKTTASQLIRVGDPTDNAMIHGRVTHAGRPVEGALVRGGDVNTWTDSEGTYVLAGLPLGNATVTAAKDGLTFTPQFTNPVQATDIGAFGIDFTANEPWTGGGGTIATLSPHRIDLAPGFSTRFTAQAFDGTGSPIAFNPTWSVTGGGTIDGNGIFTATTLGGPFTVTAEDGPLTATATLNVVDTGGPPLASGAWTNASGGSWATQANWAGNIIAGGAGNTADFSTLNITSDTTVNLDAPRSIGSLIFGDTNTSSSARWILASGTNGSLQLAGATPTIQVNPLGTGSNILITARLTGFNGFTKTGAGNIVLNNNTNTLTGPVTIESGNVLLNSASLTEATSVTINGGALILANVSPNLVGGTITFGGGNLQFNQPPGSDYSTQFSTAANQPYRITVVGTNEATFATDLASPGGTLTKLGPGTLALDAASSYDGGTTLAVGTLRFGNPAALGTGPLAITGNNTTLQAGLAATLPNDITTTNITTTLDTADHNTTLAGTLTGSGTLTKTGSGILNISGGGASNTFAGNININAGTLANDNVTPSPGIQSLANMNGNITVASGATFNFSQSFTAESLDNAITLSGHGTGTLGALNLWRNANATGPITLAADATISHTFNTATISGSITGADRNLTLTTLNANQPGMTVSGPINLGTGGITVQGVANSGNFSIRLTGNNTYSGETHVASGTLMLSGGARIQDESTVRIASTAVLHLDFTGTDQVGTLILDGVAMPDGTYGSTTSTAENKSAHFAGNGILQVGTPGNNYATWATANGIPGELFHDDFNGDGISNGMAYALGLSPTESSHPVGVLSENTITFTKGTDAIANADVSWIIQVSETLESESWTDQVTHAPGDATPTISYDFDPAPGTPKKFARLKVIQSP